MTPEPRTCSVPDCARKHKGNGYCDMHGKRMRKRGTLVVPPRDLADRFWSKVDRRGPDECWPWLGHVDRYGYGTIRPGGTAPTVAAPRVSWELEHGGAVPVDRYVCHTCDVRVCVNPAHLYVGTPAQNSADRDRRGRGRWRAVPDDDVRAIRAACAGGESQSSVGRRYGITQAGVSNIVRRVTRASVE